MSDELAVVRDGYTFTLELARRVEQFPRHQRAGFGCELARRGRDLLTALLHVKVVPRGEKPALLSAINLDLDVLRYSLRLAVDLNLLSYAAHGHLIRLANAVGVQVGGWLRALRAKDSP